MRTTLTSLFLLAFAFAAQPLFAQKLVTLQHQGDASFFTSLQGAYDAAVNGDTIYIPGGYFPGLTLNKSLALIGVGHHPDSTSATGRTILDYLNVYENADNSYITGASISGALYTSGNIINFTVFRCYLGSGIIFSSGANTNWNIFENYVGYNGISSCSNYSIYSGGVLPTNCLITNNIISNGIHQFEQSNIYNNVFLSGCLQANQSQIKNNIFSTVLILTNNSEWFNNLNNGVNGINGTNTGSNNYLDNIPLEDVFTNYAPTNTFYQNDFHVVNTAYVGDDGTPVGIYGGLFPWKAGSVPFNPHVQTKTIAPTTNAQGNLEVQVRVAAQDH